MRTVGNTAWRRQVACELRSLQQKSCILYMLQPMHRQSADAIGDPGRCIGIGQWQIFGHRSITTPHIGALLHV
uniref:Uncharacterized protein n=1 Tax=Romanomermis culicivorax TaxID=13658 RepID=A0A915KIK3_ROMCU